MQRINTLLFAAALLTMCTPAESIFNSADAVIWRHVEKPVITSMSDVQLEFDYQNPCLIFEELLAFQNESQAQFRSWCDRMYKEALEDVAPKFCFQMHRNANVLNSIKLRSKREPFTALAIGLSFVVGSVATGIGGWSLAKTFSNSELQEQNDERFARLEANEARFRKALKLMSEDIKEQADAHTMLKTTVEEFLGLFPGVVITTADLSSRLVSFQDRFKAMSNDWVNGKVNSVIEDLFEFRFPCRPNCPFKLMKPLRCELDHGRQRISMRIQAPIIDPALKYLEADPFTFFSFRDNYQCQSDYEGVKRILYNTNTNLYCPVRRLPLADNDLLMETLDDNCNLENRKQAFELWTDPKCEPSTGLKESDTIQVKINGDANHIYCYPFNITKFDITLPCPPYVFTLPVSVNFNIGRYFYRSNSTHWTGLLNVQPLWVREINTRLMPGSRSHDHQNHVDEAIKILDSIEEALNASTFPYQALITGLLAVVLFALIAYQIVKWHRRRRRRARKSVVVTY